MACFAYQRNVNAEWEQDCAVASIAAAIGEPARARMLQCLLDGRARTSTELALVAGVSPSTASAHLARLKTENLVEVSIQGKHRYYSLAGRAVARTLEGLNALAGGPRRSFKPTAPRRLCLARSCYDHIAGALGVALHDRLAALGWLAAKPGATAREYELTAAGMRTLARLGMDLEAALSARRRFAYPCLDWSERRPHLGGALGAALFDLALQRRWVRREMEVRALTVTGRGRREMQERFGLTLEDAPPD